MVDKVFGGWVDAFDAFNLCCDIHWFETLERGIGRVLASEGSSSVLVMNKDSHIDLTVISRTRNSVSFG